jgi:hypothetical protein
MVRKIFERIKKARLADKLSFTALLVTLAITFAINLPLAIWNLQSINKSNDIADQNLAILNMINNFNCDLSAVESPPGILYSSSFYPPNGPIESIDGFGQVNIVLKVVAPHYSHITIKVGNFTDLQHQGWMNPEKRNQTTISYFLNEPFEDIIGSGLTLVNTTIQLETTVYPDPQQLPTKSQSIQFPLGPLLMEAELHDIQTEKNFTREFTELMAIKITMPSS